MKTSLALVGALLLFGGTAFADGSLYSPLPVQNWSGLWIGGHAGHVEGTLTGYSGSSSGPSGTDLGIHAYYNFQHGNWVFGPYLGIPLAEKSGTIETVGNTKAEWAVTGGFRLGYAIDRWLPYGVIGAIVGGARNDYGSDPKSNTHTGYAFILGVDYAVTDRWAIGARYAHVSLSQEKYGSATNPIGWDADSFTATLTLKLF